MRILLWHGYLLRGSGSNVHTRNLARAFVHAGHEVVLMCQEHEVDGFGFVDGRVEWPSSVAPVPFGAPGCTLVRPDIGGLLPVYVYDEYPGFRVKTFPELTDAELQTYTDRNVQAFAAVLASFDPDLVIVGHEVMGPEIARRACAGRVPYVAKLHGSALEYAVKVQERYARCAASGLGGAAFVVGGSRYMVEEAARIVPGWRDRARVINPGCDVDLFRPDPARRGDVPVVGFVGKLIAAKGVQRVLLALREVETRPLRAVVVGFGGDDESLRALAAALRDGNMAAARRALDALGDPVADGALDRGGDLDDVVVEFTGRMEHERLSEVLPGFDVLTVPSVVPEAFGMVAAEAAACGVLPVAPRHSGIGEAVGAVAGACGVALTYDPDDPIAGAASAIDRVLTLSSQERKEAEGAAAELARERWSWQHVGDAFAALASETT